MEGWKGIIFQSSIPSNLLLLHDALRFTHDASVLRCIILALQTTTNNCHYYNMWLKDKKELDNLIRWNILD